MARYIDVEPLEDKLKEHIKKTESELFLSALGTFVRLLDLTPTADAVPRWIPCEERLPEEYGLYIATMNDGSVQECSYVPTDYGDVLLNGWSTCEASGFKVLNENDVLAWMPLPDPYEEERKDDYGQR